MSVLLTYRQLEANGRFGNQLFQIASTIGLAVKSGFPYGFPAWSFQKYFINKLPGIPAGTKIATLKGYQQDYRNFEECEELIRSYFLLKTLKIKKLENTIFIHFRAYSDEGVEHIHPEQETEYYQKAITHFPNKNFVIFTDNIEKAREVIQMDCQYRSGAMMKDFYLMSHCDGGIISNSSFSWWAGWLCKGPVVIPSNWFTAQATYPTAGYYMPNWITI